MSKRFIVLLLLLIAAMVGLLTLGAGKPPADQQRAALTLKEMIGKPAPDFSLKSYDGKTYSLREFRGKKVVLFFNEGIMCYPACWNQVAALGKDSRLNNAQTATLSIVPDNRDEWVAAVRRMPELSKETILLDPTVRVSAKYLTLSLPSSMHRGSKPGHTYVLVDAKGIIRYTYDDEKMGIHNDKLIAELAKI